MGLSLTTLDRTLFLLSLDQMYPTHTPTSIIPELEFNMWLGTIHSLRLQSMFSLNNTEWKSVLCYYNSTLCLYFDKTYIYINLGNICMLYVLNFGNELNCKVFRQQHIKSSYFFRMCVPIKSYLIMFHMNSKPNLEGISI